MKRFSKHFTICLFLLLTAALLACFTGCTTTTGATGELVDYENDYEWTYDLEFTRECDDYMTIDGVLDEAVWEDTSRSWLTYDQDGVKVSYTTYFTEKGLYLAAIAEDPYMQWNGRMCFNKTSTRALNSAFFFAIAGSDTTALSMTTRSYFALDSKNKASYEVTPFAAKATTDQDIDSGDASKMWGELFVTWDDLRIHGGQPEDICILPFYHLIRDPEEEKENRWVVPLFADVARFHTYSTFTEDGYVGASSEDSYWGPAASGYSCTTGWDLSQADQGIVTSNKGHSQALFVTDVSSAYYKFSVDMKVIGGLAGVDGSDGIFRAGVCAMTCAEDLLGLVLNGDGMQQGSASLYSLTNNPWNWNKFDTVKIENYDWEASQQTIHWDVIKYGATFYYFIEGQYVGYFEHEPLAGECSPGVYTLTSLASFSNASVEEYDNDKEGLRAELDKLLNFVEAPTSITGGSISVSRPAVSKTEKNPSVEVTLLPNPGYVLNTFTVNGVDKMDHVRANITRHGTFSLPVDTSVRIEASFARFDRQNEIVTIRGEAFLPDGVTVAPGATVLAYDPTNPLFSYTVKANGSGKFELKFLKPQDTAYEIGGASYSVGSTWHIFVSFWGGYTPIKRVLTEADLTDGTALVTFTSPEELKQIASAPASSTFDEDGALTITSKSYVNMGMQIAAVAGKNWTLETSIRTSEITLWNTYGLFLTYEDGSYYLFGVSQRRTADALRIIMWNPSGYQGTLAYTPSAEITSVLDTYLDAETLTLKIRYVDGDYSFYLNGALYATVTAVSLGTVALDEAVGIGFGARLDNDLPQGITFTDWGYTIDGDSTYERPGLPDGETLVSPNWKNEKYSWTKNEDGSYTFASGTQNILTGLVDTTAEVAGKKWIAEISLKTSEITQWNSYGFLLQLTKDQYAVISLALQPNAADPNRMGVNLLNAPTWVFNKFDRADSDALTNVLAHCREQETVTLRLAFDGESYSVYVNGVLYGSMTAEKVGTTLGVDATAPRAIGIGLCMDDNLPTRMTFSNWHCYIEGSAAYEAAKEEQGL